VNEDDKRKLLEVAAKSADEVADEHERLHPEYGACSVSRQMREIGGSIRATLAAGGGPAQVASTAYRASWERTFGGSKPVVGQA
jgi:hypothetical protein